MKPCHFARSCAICSHDSVGILKSLREALKVSCIAFSDHHGSVFTIVVLHRGFSGKHSSGILVAWSCTLIMPISEYVHSASLSFSGLPCLESCLATSALEIFYDSLYGNGSVFWHAVGKLLHVRIIVLVAQRIYRLSVLCQVWFHFDRKYFHVGGQMLH